MRNLKRITIVALLVLSFTPALVFAGKGGGGGGSPAPSCSAYYYCSEGNRYYQDGSCNTSLVESCSYGCSGGTCSVPPPLVNPPSCSVTLGAASIPYGGSTSLSWTSTNSTSLYINGVGYVLPSGSVTIYSGGTYTGHASGPGGEVNCSVVGGAGGGAGGGTGSFVVTVIPPPLLTATIAAEDTTIYTGDSTTVSATFAVGGGDTLVETNIDQPLGTAVASSGTLSSRTYSFTPSAPGTYTFYARAVTDYYSNWTTYGSVSVTVSDPPSCTPSYTCAGSDIQHTNARCEVSTSATCSAPSFCAIGSSVCHYPSISFEPFTNDDEEYVDGHFYAQPNFIPSGFTTRLFWNVSNVGGCTVTGNGETWNLTYSGSGGQQTNPITHPTTFTLVCTALPGTGLPSISEDAVVNVLPVFNEG